MKQFIIDELDVGTRLDTFAAQQMTQLSRAFIQKLAEQGKIQVAGMPAKVGYKVREGDLITIDYDESELENIPVIDLPVIYEDDDCIVINKPAGILTHAQGHLSTEPSVATFLRDKLKGLSGARGGIVHRLDRATSGVIMCAKTPEALSYMQKQFSQRKVKKTYMAIVKGHVEPAEALIDMPIERNPKAPATFRVGHNGKPSQTHYIVKEETELYSLVELKPVTGRTHQLRVHMQQQGFPIVGDPLYGTGAFGDRLFLHAYSLEITIPSRERKVFTAPVPGEFKRLMQTTKEK